MNGSVWSESNNFSIFFGNKILELVQFWLVIGWGCLQTWATSPGANIFATAKASEDKKKIIPSRFLLMILFYF